MRRCGVGAVIDAIRVRRESIDAQRIPMPAQTQLSRHGVDEHELVADIERYQGLRAVRSYEIDRRDFMVAGETQDRELAIVGYFRRLKVARTLDLAVQIARPIDDRSEALRVGKE